ncbi:MAG: energy transducer TonB [Proteobacteria bacterium]|nr:energy transducer TonB [Pseudomonadota bacterium]
MIAIGAAAPAFAQEASGGWAAIPTQAELLASYPPGAIENHVVGEAVLSCAHDAHGVLEHCKVVWDDPKDAGFGAAALSVVGKFRIDPSSRAMRLPTMDVPFFFGAGVQSRPLREAVFTQAKKGYERLAPAGPYWPERALRVGAQGMAQVDCRVTADNHLKDCKIADDVPVGMGFVFATLKMAQAGWMMAGPPPAGVAAPVDGYWRFEVRFPPRSL